MPQFKLDRYDVLIRTDDGQEGHTVTVYHADQLLAEKEGGRYGIGQIKLDDDGKPDPNSALGQHVQTMHVWAALKRERKYDKPFANFLRTDCLAIQEAEALVVDPTSAGTDSPSSSDTTGRPSLSGSTPMD